MLTYFGWTCLWLNKCWMCGWMCGWTCGWTCVRCVGSLWCMDNIQFVNIKLGFVGN
ncbi:hypothetical protein M6B38_267725 [Iris pallida]|uniref:Uncharacterized protein n=1 Tax=Iris pallida TaxID=29817 RepID=A0AAX6IAZ4_IRIPA|nr:hypothetical protein M6B38_140840 [Iris pallida]KAJ6823219.1 hypothetical protein M6B38_384480 [Iris pallida]KAJ6849585.1 hypothetical protein M6B38_267725 [Iris pallida]